jgi:hypothetical protein
MKKLSSFNVPRNKKMACMVSAAALMLGVSSATTIGLHFQDNYCGAPAYSGFVVTKTAFGIPTNGWENLLPMSTGYSSCSGPLTYTLGPELIDTTTTTNGLNPLPNGAITVTWSGSTANFDPFGGYAGVPPTYQNAIQGTTGAYDDATNPITGEQQVYASFIRDGLNFGPGEANGNNTEPVYLIDVTGLKSLFTNSSFVVELMASADSMQTLTNALVIDVPDSLTNTVSYPSTPPITAADNQGGAAWVRGIGGGLSTGTGAIRTDHIQITSVQPQHGGSNPGYDNAGTISGFILTDKPLVTMSPRSIAVAGPGDSIVLSAYAIGVPPLSLQWRLNGNNIPGATNLSYAIPSVTLANNGNYVLVVTNVYGATTSLVATVTVDRITQTTATNIVADSNPANPQHNGVNMGAAWEASSTGGTVTRTGVMSFAAAQTNGISVGDSTNFNGPTGTITMWIQTAGVVDPTGNGVSLFCRPSGSSLNNFLLSQADSGNINFNSPNPGGVAFTSTATVADNRWHFLALTFDQTATGGVALFVDGNLDQTNNNTASWSWTTGEPLEIGYTTDTSYGSYNGLMDDVRYYGTVLTANQIKGIYTSDALEDTTDLQMQLNFTAAPGEGMSMTWLETSAVLQSASSLTGPWTDVNGAVSPYIIVPAATQQFFRYRYVPQSLQSNPYLM